MVLVGGMRFKTLWTPVCVTVDMGFSLGVKDQCQEESVVDNVHGLCQLSMSGMMTKGT